MQRIQSETGVDDGLEELTQKVQAVMGENLISAILFGSAAEGHIGVTSDINLLLLLKKFEQSEVDEIRESLLLLHAMERLEVMFLLESEKERAMDAFSVKFSDILSRRRVLYGPDPFADSTILPASLLHRTQQILLNLMLRMRERYSLVSLREEKLANIIADVIGPLRACAGAILKLEGRKSGSPREAFITLLSESDELFSEEIFMQIDRLRQQGSLPPGSASKLLFALIEIAQYMYQRAAQSRNHADGEARG